MRLLAIVHKYPPIHNAGAEWMLHAILRDFVRRGDEAVVVYEGAPTYELDGVFVTASPRYLEKVAAEVDVVVTHLDRTKPAVAAARRARRPLVHLVHNDRQLQFHNIAPADDVLVVPNSEWLDATLDAGYRRLICRPPVAVADYDVELEQRAGRAHVTLVNMTTTKGAGTFYRAAAALPELPFLGVLGAYGIQSIRPATRLRNVELIENTAAIVEAVYSRTRILLMPSSYESWGRVAIEAAASGIPTIAHPTAGLRESLADAGIFAQRSKAGAWVAKLRELAEPDAYATASSRARARAEELDAITTADLDALHAATLELVEDRRRAEPAAYAQRVMTIIDSRRAGLRCPICRAPNCNCGGPTTTTDGVVVVNRLVRPRGEPWPIYRTWRGDFRYSPERAIRYGLLPAAGDTELPRLIASRFSAEALEELRPRYAGASHAARKAFLAEVALIRPKYLERELERLLEVLEAGPADPEAELELDDGNIVDGRVGDVLERVGTDPERLTEALEAERAGRRRPTLIAELQRRLEEV